MEHHFDSQQLYFTRYAFNVIIFFKMYIFLCKRPNRIVLQKCRYLSFTIYSYHSLP